MAAFPPTAPNLFIFSKKKQKGFPLKSGCKIGIQLNRDIIPFRL
jgi:hypothetical protein